MPAPTVQALQDIIAQIQAAQAPELKSIDDSVQFNETSGAGAEAGLNSAKTSAFGNIEQRASDKGMFFSGFSPAQQASYTGSTYLPALAKLKNTIATTRNTLLGQKAGLATQANTQALGIRNDQQKTYDAYIAEQERAAREEAARERDRQFQASENAKQRAASVVASRGRGGGAAKGPTAAQQLQADTGTLAGALKKVTGRDGFVSPKSFASARQEWVSAGYSASDFNNRFRNFANLTYGPKALKDYGLK